jgi:hypothetical protein
MTLRSALKSVLQGLLVLPFVLAQFFAQHTMLSDEFEVVLCSSDGPVTLVIGADGVPRPAEDHASECVWAATPVFDLAALPALSMAPVAMARPSAQVAPARLVIAADLSRLPEARAPPVLSI